MRRATKWPTRGILSGLFQSTLSMRRATHYPDYGNRPVYISIHALHEESDSAMLSLMAYMLISIHALHEESDLLTPPILPDVTIFQSTLSMRRATFVCTVGGISLIISIHALHEESDAPSSILSTPPLVFQSTLSMRRATGSYVITVPLRHISIHALHEESDLQV